MAGGGGGRLRRTGVLQDTKWGAGGEVKWVYVTRIVLAIGGVRNREFPSGRVMDTKIVLVWCVYPLPECPLAANVIS